MRWLLFVTLAACSFEASLPGTTTDALDFAVWGATASFRYLVVID